jgi:hypothetical protein
VTAPHRKYALLAAADALEADDRTLRDLIEDDGKDAPLTALQVISALRLFAGLEANTAPDSSHGERPGA